MREAKRRITCIAVMLAAAACGSGADNGPLDTSIDHDAETVETWDPFDVPVEPPVDVPLEEAADVPVDEVSDEAEAADIAPEDAAEEEPAGTYTELKCCRNGSEICDDESFRVPSPYVPMVLVCDNGNGGVIYVSTNTGPPCLDDGVPRCRGWEERGENPWDHLEYVVQFDCLEAGTVHDIDLSAHEGERLYVGVHDQPDGGGHMTRTCVGTRP